MTRFRRLPGAALAVGAFVMTVLLGAGMAPASALWQQSATASMTVSAATTWPGAAFEASCSSWGQADRTVVISYTLPESVQSVTISASRPDGSFSEPRAAFVFGRIGATSVDTADEILSASTRMNVVTLRVTATYMDQTEFSSELTVKLDPGTSNRKIYCG